MTAPEINPLGIDGIHIRFARVLSDDANRRALAFATAVEAAALRGVTEVASSLTSVRVAFDPEQTDRARLTPELQAIAADVTADALAPKRRWTIPVAFGPDSAPQLAEAAQIVGLSEAQAVAEITGQTLRVIALGFAPGQAYLGMLPPHWDMPRQAELTPYLPRGALIGAVRQLIIWSADAPTGWRQLGLTAFEVYRPESDAPFAFAPGDEVRFHPASDAEVAALRAGTDPDGGARCEVLR